MMSVDLLFCIPRVECAICHVLWNLLDWKNLHNKRIVCLRHELQRCVFSVRFKDLCNDGCWQTKPWRTSYAEM